MQQNVIANLAWTALCPYISSRWTTSRTSLAVKYRSCKNWNQIPRMGCLALPSGYVAAPTLLTIASCRYNINHFSMQWNSPTVTAKLILQRYTQLKYPPVALLYTSISYSQPVCPDCVGIDLSLSSEAASVTDWIRVRKMLSLYHLVYQE